MFEAWGTAVGANTALLHSRLDVTHVMAAFVCGLHIQAHCDAVNHFERILYRLTEMDLQGSDKSREEIQDRKPMLKCPLLCCRRLVSMLFGDEMISSVVFFIRWWP